MTKRYGLFVFLTFVVSLSLAEGPILPPLPPFPVPPPHWASISVAISPTSTALQAGKCQQFAATVRGTTDTSVSWSASGGTISASGLYTAPSAPGSYVVTATSMANKNKWASAALTVTVPVAVAVSLSPTSASMLTSGTQQFTATVTGSSNTAVTWSASGGTVSASGLYTAPATAGSYMVTATSQADTTKSAAATVTINAPVAVSLSPTSASILTGGTQQFTAAVTGSSNTAVTWSATGGTISASGLYTAPATAGSYTVTATSQADATKSASANVTVSAAPVVSVTISPTSSSILTSGTQQFTATVSGSSNTAVTWSATGGTISSSGLYTAPATAGSYKVTATSQADTTKSASATVTVSAAPVVSVSISPTSASILTSGTQQFTATVTGSSNTAVNWSATAGTVSSSGLYTAPATAGSYTVTATSQADTTKSASATLTVSAAPVVSVTISPTSSSILSSGTQQFTATVSGSSNTAVTWSATGGTISSSGLYTAPATAGTYTVTATSQADATKSGSATVTVSAPVAVSLSPTSASMLTNGTQQFTATVTGTTNTAVSWSATAGSISSGLYTAPSTAGTYTVTATSTANTSASASATVTVSAPGPSATPILVSRTQGSNSLASQLSNDPSVYHAYLPDGAISGNTIAVAFQYASGPTPSFADDQGNAYTVACTVTDSANSRTMGWATAPVTQAGARAITMSLNAAGVNNVAVHVFQFANVGAVDSCAGNSGTSTTVTAGSILPTVAGDLLLQAMAKDANDTKSTITAGSQSNITWQLATADLQDTAAMGVQWGVYDSTSALAPTMTTGGSTSNAFLSVALALQPAAAGGDLPNGIQIRGMLHFSSWSTGTCYSGDCGPGYSNPTTVAAPSYGNLLVLADNGSMNSGTTQPVSAISDNLGNTWTALPAAVDTEDGSHSNGDQFWYCSPCTTGPNLVLTVTQTDGSSRDHTLNIYDIKGAASSAFDTYGDNSGGQWSYVSSLSTASVTPSTANGLVLFVYDNGNNTVTGMTSGQLVDSEWYSNESDSGPQNVDQNNGWGHYYNPNTASVTGIFTFGLHDATDAQGYWAASAAAFKAASVSDPVSVSVSVSPSSATLASGATQQFTATVSGTTNTAVTWSATGGAVSTSGLYTAPSTAGTYTVTATSQANTSVSASATVTVSAPVQPTVTLTWTADTSSVGGYNVYRGTVSGGPYTMINTALDAATNYVDNTVVAGQTYYYVTTAVSASGLQSGYSNQVVAAVP